MSVAKKQYKRITTKSLVEMKANGEKISMLTRHYSTFTILKKSCSFAILPSLMVTIVVPDKSR